MQLKRLLLFVVACAACCAAGGVAPVRAAETTSVALTLTKEAEAGKLDPLAENLLSLVELAVQQDKSLSIVERRQIEPVIQELILDQARPGDAQLQLGKLITADDLVMLELLPPDKDSPKPWGRLRVVDAKTGAIRGVTVAGLDEATLEETAEQFARYASAVIRAPNKPTATVAVAPFESRGRFDRLRPLELGIRDLVTARLLTLAGAASAGPGEAENKPAAEPPRFQVLQRSSMEQLLRELDLIQSGLSDKSRLPVELPSRGAAYLIRGEIDERQAGEKHEVVVRGELVEATTQRVLEKFELECPPVELEAKLAEQVDRISERLATDEKIRLPARVPEHFESRSLKELAMADVRRFTRRSPTDFGYRVFRLSGDPATNYARVIKPGSAQGHYVLRKSIDRLETILFITPDDAETAYALGYCYSFHEPDIYQPKRADELLRKAYLHDPEAELAAFALGVLAEISYHHETAELDPGSKLETRERLWLAFERTPAKFRDHHWPRYLEPLGQMSAGTSNPIAAAGEVMDLATPFAENPDTGKFRNMVADSVARFASTLGRQRNDANLSRKGNELLERWQQSKDPELVRASGWSKATFKALGGDHGGAAAAFEARAAQATGLERGILLVKAAKSYRQAGDPERAMKLLLTLEAKDPPGTSSLYVGMLGLELGSCYQTLGQPEKALAVYIRAAEDCPGVVDNSDIISRITALGGVSLREDREVDVVYYPLPKKPSPQSVGPLIGTCLASDGQRIFYAGARGLEVFDTAAKTWDRKLGRSEAITCLGYGRDGLWTGTDHGGLRRWSLSGGAWQESVVNPLPDSHIESIKLVGDDVYVGVGTTASGGLVRIDKEGNVHVFDEAGAPTGAPTHVVVTDEMLLACTPTAVYQYSPATKTWSARGADTFQPFPTPRLFAGENTVWASAMRHELTRWPGPPAENSLFQATWFNGRQKLGYDVNFVTQRGDDVWFGGSVWERFASAGLYRFNLRTAVFYKFGPRDGFKACQLHNVYDGLWLNDRLWLATDQGLCVVTPRSPVASLEAPSGPAP